MACPTDNNRMVNVTVYNSASKVPSFKYTTKTAVTIRKKEKQRTDGGTKWLWSEK